MLQKASELAAEVRNLGAALLSALEKQDAEAPRGAALGSGTTAAAGNAGRSRQAGR